MDGLRKSFLEERGDMPAAARCPREQGGLAEVEAVEAAGPGRAGRWGRAERAQPGQAPAKASGRRAPGAAALRLRALATHGVLRGACVETTTHPNVHS